ncbi:MAG: PilZ domain-containing protein [Desulfobacterales bacterium]
MSNLPVLFGWGVVLGAALFTLILLLRFLRGTMAARRREPLLVIDPRHAAGPPGAEKRLYTRVAVSWAAELELREGQTRRETRLQDIGMGGAFVLSPDPPEPGSELRLRLLIPGADPLELNAVVAWNNAGVPADRVLHRGMGVRFCGNPPETHERLHRAIRGLLGREEKTP